jgi:hypothetical protein
VGPRSKREYARAIYQRYKQASRREKKAILDEFCTVCNYHRKHATRVFSGFEKGKDRTKKNGKRGRPEIYRLDAVLKPLKKIWLAANLPCSKRLKTIVPLWLKGYQEQFGPLDDKIVQKLNSISPATIDRLLDPVRARNTKHGRSTTKPGTLLRKQIPIKTNQWDESRPGFIEADTVAHCGNTLLGMFAYTVDFVDIATGWTEQRAVWGKGETGVMEQIKDVEAMLPFSILGFDSDNGSEFLNHHIFKYFLDRKYPVQFTRSRAYHKDDNSHIEQKNWTHVRQWLGYQRLDNPDAVLLLNQLYRSEWRLFHNFFCPSVKLISKERVGSKTFKRHDLPKTPYQRIMESKHIDSSKKYNLTKQLENLNPFLLRKQMELKLKKIFQLMDEDIG